MKKLITTRNAITPCVPLHGSGAPMSELYSAEPEIARKSTD